MKKSNGEFLVMRYPFDLYTLLHSRIENYPQTVRPQPWTWQFWSAKVHSINYLWCIFRLKEREAMEKKGVFTQDNEALHTNTYKNEIIN